MIGEERMRYSWPFRSIADAGGRLAFGTDYPVTELNPLRGTFRAVTRLTDESLQSAVHGLEKLNGSQQPEASDGTVRPLPRPESEAAKSAVGKLADLTILATAMILSAACEDAMFGMGIAHDRLSEGETVYSK